MTHAPNPGELRNQATATAPKTDITKTATITNNFIRYPIVITALDSNLLCVSQILKGTAQSNLSMIYRSTNQPHDASRLR